MNTAKIIGTGSYLPEKVLTNDDLSKRVDTSDEWIVARTGIHSRHIAAHGETTASMAEKASLKALKAARVSPTQIDLIIVATCTPEHFFPSTACLLQRRLNIVSGFAFDISAACSGFVYALTVAEQMIRSGMIKHALVVGSEVMSRVVNWKDRNTCVLFGDGAGAVILKNHTEPGIIASELFASGEHQNVLKLSTGIHHHETPTVEMQGKALFKLAVEGMASSVKSLLAANKMTVDDIDWIVPHQANLRMIDAILKRINFPLSRVILTVGEHANTSAASIALALDHGISTGQIKPGQTLLLEAFGGGLTWGGMLLKY